MFDLEKLSYGEYGMFMIALIVILATLDNLFPFSLLGLFICLCQIPLYLIIRANLKEPIHAVGLNECCCVTIVFFALLFVSIKLLLLLINLPLAIIFTCLLNAIGCYVTSTLPNLMERKGKLFFGYKKHNDSKYNKLIEFIKFNGIDTRLLEAEEKLKALDTQMYLLYKRKFREDKTFKEMVDEFDIDNPRIVEILDKVYFYMIGALKI